MDALTMPTPEEALAVFRPMVQDIRKGDPADTAFPLMLYGAPDGPTMMVLALDFDCGAMTPVIEHILSNTVPNLGHPHWLVVLAEGALPTGHPAVLVYGISANKTEYGCIAPYAVGPEGDVTWGQTFGSAAIGGIPNTLRRYVHLQTTLHERVN